MGNSTLETVRFGRPSTTEGFDEWRQICAQNFLGDTVWPIAGERGFSGEFQRRWIDDCIVMRYTVTPYAGRFRPASEAGEFVGFGVTWDGGGETFTTRRDSSVQEANSMLGIWDNGSIADFSVNVPREQSYIFVPKDALARFGVRVRDLAEPLSVDDKPSARILAGVIDSVLNAPPHVELPDAVAIRNAVLSLLTGTLRDTSGSETGAVSEAMKRKVEDWVTSRLSDGTISPVDAAAAHGISVRSLHRLFSDSGGTFGDMVRALRLERARQDLALTSRTVQAIATQWGYADVSHFCREFKRTYGMTTTAFRNEVSAQDAVAS
ncbi:helix-turn-helix transcriptional regulator [Nocardioides sp. CER19]|uniref:AraC family transcriptional regulator n=1 Tax=Nocardioides sp. CER19 TaxID=3038538 RepID=UPI00244A783D|nr:helix-turn-helix transcriptional regulator [Nocardioides sp. CER19]MDH2416132.1 helix-turn-helix transcriptional regulator [Nocardioides sp. CER19]